LKDRGATGEFQPKRLGGVADGPPIADYFPRIVSEDEWQLARQKAATRYRKPGRVGAVVNVFQGLIKGAIDGESYVVGSQSSKNPHAVLRSAAPRKGIGRCASFPLYVFEQAILGALRELDPSEILHSDRPDQTLRLAGELAGVEERIAAIEDELLSGSVPALTRGLRRLECQRQDLAESLAAARREAANPLSEAWGEAQTLLSILSDAANPKEARLRLRSALRRIVDEVRILVVPKGRDRLAS